MRQLNQRRGGLSVPSFHVRHVLASVLVSVFLVSTCQAQEGAASVPDSRPTAFEGVASVSQLPTGPPEDAVFLSLAKCKPGFEVSASLLYLQPLSGNLQYATKITPFPFQTPHWNDQTVNPDLTPAFNVGVRYDFGCGADTRLDWTSLNSHDSAGAEGIPLPHVINLAAGVVPPTAAFYLQALGPPFLVGPPPPFTSAQAELHFAYDAVNWDVGLLINVGSHNHVRLFAGLEGARIGQTLTGNFQSPGDVIAFTDTSRSVFTGVGPRLGIEEHCTWGSLDFLSGIAGALLIGGAQNNIAFNTNSIFYLNVPRDAFINNQYITTPTTTRVVPSIDAKLGASYTHAVGRLGRLKCEGGYQAAVYFNAVSQFSISEVENSLTGSSETDSFSGVFLRTVSEQQSNFVVHGPYLKLAIDF
jgi:hypothetical protein